MSEFNLSVKRKFVLFCREKKITQAAIANATGVSAETARRWFNFEVEYLPPLSAIGWLRENYGLDVNRLLDKKGCY